MKPGATMRPVASKISVEWSSAIRPGSATSAILSPSSRTSRGASVSVAGSMTRPFLTRSMRRILFSIGGRPFPGILHLGSGMRLFFRAAHKEQEEQRHAHGDPIGDLLEDAGLRTVGDFRSDLHAAIHRAGMENDGVGLGEAQALGAELIEKNVVSGGKRGFVKPLGLYAQNQHDVGIFESLFDSEDAANRSAGRANAFQFARNPHGRSAQREAATEFRQKVNVGASDSAVSNVPENRDMQISERALAVADGEGIQQALRRMLVSAVARVDDGNIEMARDKVRSAGSCVAHDQAIRLHGIERVDGIEKGLALFHAGRFRLEVHGVRAKTRSGGAEADACAGGVFKER